MLGIDAAFDGVARERDVLLAIAERRAGGDADLLAHDVDAADHLRDRMLDLEPRVHLDEKELAVLIEEFERAGALVAELRASRSTAMRADAARARAALSAGDGVSSSSFWCLRCSEQSRSPRWMTPPCAVAEDLHLDMARPVEIALEIDRAVAEEGLRFGLRRSERAPRSSPRRAPRACRARRRPPPP